MGLNVEKDKNKIRSNSTLKRKTDLIVEKKEKKKTFNGRG